MVNSWKAPWMSRKYDVAELDQRCDYYNGAVDEKRFGCTTQKRKTQNHIDLLMVFQRSSGEFWGLEDYWTQISVLSPILFLNLSSVLVLTY